MAVTALHADMRLVSQTVYYDETMPGFGMVVVAEVANGFDDVPIYAETTPTEWAVVGSSEEALNLAIADLNTQAEDILHP